MLVIERIPLRSGPTPPTLGGVRYGITKSHIFLRALALWTKPQWYQHIPLEIHDLNGLEVLYQMQIIEMERFGNTFVKNVIF